MIKRKKDNIKQDEVDETASKLGHISVKYFDLRKNPTTNYVFFLGSHARKERKK